MSHENNIQVSDYELLSDVNAGETAAYGQLVDRYQGKLFNFAFQIVGNADDAKDVAQDAFIKVLEALPRLKPDLNFSAYLYKTARNLAIDEITKRKRFGSSEALETKEEPGIHADPQRSVFLEEQKDQARAAVESMPENFRMALSLKELAGLSYDEISEVTGIPTNTLGKLLSRARLKFKQEFRMSEVNVEQLPKDCKDMLPMLSAYLDNELGDEQRFGVRNHLGDCAFCRLAMEEMAEASKSYRTFIPLVPPDELRAQTLSNLGITDATTSYLPTIETAGQMSSMAERARAGLNTLTRRLSGLSWRSRLAAGLAVVLLGSGGTVSGLYAVGALGNRDAAESGALKPSPTRPFIDPDVELPAPIVLPEVAENVAAGETESDESTDPTSAPARTTSTTPQASTTTAPATVTTPTSTTLPATTVPPDTTPPTVTTSPPDTELDDTPPSMPKVSVSQEGSNATLSWEPVEDQSEPVTYAVEIWATDGDIWYQIDAQYGLTATSHFHQMQEEQERWTVWAIDAAGNESGEAWGDLEWYIDFQ